MTAPKMYLFIFSLENVSDALSDKLIPGTSVEMTFFRLMFVAKGEKVE